MNKTDNKRLFKAIEEGDLPTIDGILNKNPGEVDVFGISNKFCRDKTPLMYSLQCANFPLAQKFVDMGADVNARMAGGPKTSVLQLVMEFGHPRSPYYESFANFARVLLSKGSDPSDALWRALGRYDRNRDRAEMVELLIEHGANVNHRLAGGQTIREMILKTKHTDRILKLCGVAP